MADALCGSMDAAEYKHFVLGPIFLKYIPTCRSRNCRTGNDSLAERCLQYLVSFWLAAQASLGDSVDFDAPVPDYYYDATAI